MVLLTLLHPIGIKIDNLITFITTARDVFYNSFPECAVINNDSAK
jgi:hypothetical protein